MKLSRRTLLLAGVALLALSLRPAVTAVSPVLEEVQADLGMSTAAAGVLGTAPLLSFAVLAALAPAVIRRLGLERAAWGAMLLVAVGTGLRALAPGTVSFVAMSLLALSGMGIGNVAVPPLVRRYFPDRVGAVTALYVVLLCGGTALPAQLAVPVAEVAGWRVSIASWAVLAGVAAVPWVVQSTRTAPAADPLLQPQHVPLRTLVRSSLAWGLALTLGLTALSTYAVLSWLPLLLADAGLDPAAAGTMLALYASLGMPISLLVPLVAGRMTNPFGVVVVAVVLYLVGYAGLGLAPGSHTWLWVSVLGVAPLTFPLVLTLLSLRSRTPQGAAGLAGFVQAVGYAVAGLGPLVFGLLHDVTGSWAGSLAFLAAVLPLLLVAAVFGCRPVVLEDTLDLQPVPSRFPRRFPSRSVAGPVAGSVRPGPRYPAAIVGRVTPAQLSTVIRDVLAAVTAQESWAVEVPAEVRVERPRSREHGDWSTNVALQLGRQAGVPPRDLAGRLAGRLVAVPGVKSVDVAGPGFLNITLDAAAAGELARSVVEAGRSYGRNDSWSGQRVNLEFVSANPTGPIHLGGVRWAAVGDSLARVLQACGAEVTREYYFNDHGAQIDRFARSLLAAARGEPVPSDGYGGTYIAEIAGQVLAVRPDALCAGDPQEVFRSVGVELMFAEIRTGLHDFGVDFDVYFHENTLHESGAVQRAIARLREQGNIYEADGATWLRTTAFGDDKDRVLVKGDGQPAYISGDLAYYLDKRERGFDRCLIMLGADHHGYVRRMMAMCAAFGDAPGVNLEILIGQMVNLLRGGEPLRMSKRAGTIVTMDDLVEAVGVDAGRYSLVRSSSDSSIDIDLDLLARRTTENPVYYVQYAHARSAGVSRNAAELGVRRDDAFDPSLLAHPTETALLAALGDYPRVVAQAAELREPHRVARHLELLAGTFHKWYDSCRVTPQGDEPVTDAHRTRLWLNDATRQVLANSLGLLGVSAPERM